MKKASSNRVWNVLVPVGVFIAAVAVYLNTLSAGFAFDDNFAVINNKDVSDASISIIDILQHDFWGQNIRSEMSHKSYRPLTILMFRLIHYLWTLVPYELRAKTPWAGKVTSGGNSSLDAVPLDPFPFHLANILLHGAVSVCVYWLAHRLFDSKEAAIVLDQIRDQRQQRSMAAAAASAQGKGAPGAATPGKASSGGTQSTVRERKGKGAKASPQPAPPAATPSPAADKALEQVKQEGKWRAHIQATIAAFSFALHPIHTEAVAGIVGQAELLCALLCLLSMLLYMQIADGRYHGFSLWIMAVKVTAPADDLLAARRLEAWQHWTLLMACPLLIWTAALAKEIGITVVAAMVAYEMYVEPATRFPVAELQPYLMAQELLIQSQVQLQQHQETLMARANAKGLSPQEREHQQKMADTGAAMSKDGVAKLKNGEGMAAWRTLQRRRVARIVFLTVVCLLYIKSRGWVAGDHLVRIYRKMENPIPFLSTRFERALTTLHLHTRYFQLLFFPHPLSADWSYNCIPPVTSIWDSRNLASFAFHTGWLFCLRVARPLEFVWRWIKGPKADLKQKTGLAKLLGDNSPLVDHLQKKKEREEQHVTYSRWRLVPMFGLMAAPFIPAANIFFYVGTFIGERLLYMPSVGACIFSADLLGWQLLELSQIGTAALPAVVSHLQDKATAGQGNGYEPLSPQASGALQAGRPRRRSMGSGLQAGVIAVAVLVLALFAHRTYLRNWDWHSEETLFRAAEKVCPNSTKVQLNMGILSRRQENFTEALEHFKRAQDIEPSFCEPNYWQGLTYLNLNQAHKAIKELEKGLSCKYTAVDSLNVLNTVHKAMDETMPREAKPYESWGHSLLQPGLGRVVDGCNALEKAALIYAADQRNLSAAFTAVDACLAALKSYNPPSLPVTMAEYPLDPPVISPGILKQTSECVKARQNVYTAIAKHGLTSRSTRRFAYKYISGKAGTCRGALLRNPPFPLGPGNPGLSPHMNLIHRIQSSDAEDPWLQLEWGETLVAEEGRVRESLLHLQVAAAMLLNPHHGRSPAFSMDGDGPVTPRKAAEGAVRALQRAVAIAPRTPDVCVIRSSLCSALSRLGQLSNSRTSRETAEKQSRQCLEALSALEECEHHRASGGAAAA